MMYDKTWTLFLDRDGVLNEDNPGGYVKDLDKYRIMPGVKEAMKKLSNIFGTIVVCTNQRGVAKGVFTIETMHAMNDILLRELHSSGGRIDKIYYAVDLEDNAPNRKPNPGMALQAKQDFPSIDFSKSIMVGNRLSDMQFARNAGIAKTVFVTTTDNPTMPNELIDEIYPDLKSFADGIIS